MTTPEAPALVAEPMPVVEHGPNWRLRFGTVFTIAAAGAGLMAGMAGAKAPKDEAWLLPSSPEAQLLDVGDNPLPAECKIVSVVDKNGRDTTSLVCTGSDPPTPAAECKIVSVVDKNGRDTTSLVCNYRVIINNIGVLRRLLVDL